MSAVIRTVRVLCAVVIGAGPAHPVQSATIRGIVLFGGTAEQKKLAVPLISTSVARRRAPTTWW